VAGPSGARDLTARIPAGHGNAAGRTDERAGELPKAYVVSAQQITPQELIDYVAVRVAPHKRIYQVSFTDAIPTSPSGKTLRRLLIAGEQHRS
jgi:acyl-CoA synthetase (AMP-forming)/AMP-acid ligase II